ncbi:MAG: sigma 54-interacting transcriptional regulator [Planctomycetes bacterium]|nr:sigma 54-interacting transcriptional regulator [Planctomycetota bacterium]
MKRINKTAQVILDSVADGVFTIDKERHIQSFNKAAQQITGVPREQAIGEPCWEVFRASICESECALKHTLETGRPVVNRAVYIVNASGERIPISISTAILRDENGEFLGGVETFRDLSLVEELRREVTKHYTFSDIISKNHRMQEIFDVLPRIADSESTVLIEGQSGTGKELVARAIHNLSPRSEGPLVTVNCGALPDSLLESELFGHVAGAFTDAKKDKPGRFARAESGTIFLDEIGDVSPALQVRLLRVLQEKTYEPLGGTKPQKADVRVLTATNKDLSELVEKGDFRKDLYYRVNVVSVKLPPLKERRDDIPLLIDHFLSHLRKLQRKEVNDISPEALNILMNHDFPGNIRELENIIEHAFVVCDGAMIEPRHLPENLRESQSSASLPTGKTLKELEAHWIYHALERNDWNRTKTADELGIHKTTLWRKMNSYDISHPENR